MGLQHVSLQVVELFITHSTHFLPAARLEDLVGDLFGDITGDFDPELVGDAVVDLCCPGGDEF